MAAHPIVHLELSAKDPAAASRFYADIFGWKIEVDPRFNYHQFDPQNGPGGAFVEVDGKQYNAGDVVAYIGTDDIERDLRQISERGGKVLVPKTEIPGVGWFGMFADPTGNRLGLYTSANPR